MKDFIMIALAESESEVIELTYIYKVASEGYRFKQLGKIAHMKMKKGDFTNSPKIRKEIKKKIKKDELKGYGINAK